MKQVQATQPSAERGEMLPAEIGNEVDVQRCPLQTVERARERARECVGNIQLFTELRQRTDRSLVIGGSSDLHMICVQAPAELIGQVLPVLTFNEQESRFFVAGLWMQLPDVLASHVKHGDGPRVDKGKAPAHRGLADHPDEYQFRIQARIWRLRLHRFSSSGSFTCRECTEYQGVSQALFSCDLSLQRTPIPKVAASKNGLITIPASTALIMKEHLSITGVSSRCYHWCPYQSRFGANAAFSQSVTAFSSRML